MSALSSIMNKLSDFTQNHPMSCSNGILILLTVVAEQIFKLVDFQCPSTQPAAWYYSVAIFVIPCIVLGLLGWAVSNMTWRILHGCCQRSKESKNASLTVFEHFIAIVSRSAVVPVIWLFLMFLDGNFFACMQSVDPSDKFSKEYMGWKSTSQVIGWLFLLGAVAINFTAISIVRCCDSATYGQYKYITAYRKAEEDEFCGILKERADALAKENVKTFIMYPSLVKEDWDEISVAPQLCSSWPAFTPLHQWTSNKKQEIAQKEQTKIPTQSS